MKRRFHNVAEPDIAARLVAAEMQRHLDDTRLDEDIKADDEWMRRSQRATPSGGVVEIAYSVDEWVRRSRELLEAKRELEHQAYHDPLTSLPNRRALSEHIARILAETKAGLFDVAVLHVDLDKFKAVNDTLGHDAGDLVIREAARILKECARTTDLVARIGGDEFVVVCHAITKVEHAAYIAQRIVDMMCEPIPYGEDHCQIGASVGIALCRNARDLSTAMTDADIALYEAKRNGRGCFRVFSPVYREQYTRHQRKVAEVTAAVNFEAFEPWFQPLICANTGALLGAEALARWIDRERGVLRPSAFTAALDDIELCARIDEIVLRRALGSLARWDAAGLNVGRVSVNLSSHQLAKEGFVDRIKWLVDEAGLTPERVGVEIQERVIVDDAESLVARNVLSLARSGFHVSLDDFGTGRSSIAGLKTLALQCMKIDRRFCQGVADDRELRMITGAMITLGRNLGIEVHCEGVETPDDHRTLKELGCDVVQGYLFGKPMPEDVFGRWVERQSDPVPFRQAPAA